MAEGRESLWLWDRYLRGVADVPVGGTSDIDADDLLARAIGAMHRGAGGALYTPDEVAKVVRETRERAGLDPAPYPINADATDRQARRWRPLEPQSP